MIFIVHGDNEALSRKLIINHFKNKDLKNKKELYCQDTTPTALGEVLMTRDLFGDSSIVILNVTSAKPAQLEEYLPVIKRAPEEEVLVLLSTKSLAKTNPILKFGQESKIKIVENKRIPEGNVFKLVELLITQRRTEAYRELKRLNADGNDPFYLFSMILYGMRNLLNAVVKSEKFLQMKPFQQAGLRARATKTTFENTREAYVYMYELDKKAKNGEITPEIMITLSVEKMLNF